MKALLIDGPNLVRRIYAGVPKTDSSQGDAHIARVISAVMTSLQRALRFHHPSHVVAAFDSTEPTWRHALYPDYKKNRSLMPDPLREAMPDLKTAFLKNGVGHLERDGFETDDIIATIARKISQNGGCSTILSTDRHYCQLLSRHIQVYDHFGQQPLGHDLIRERFGIDPADLPFFLALTGDSGKSISGVPGIGPHTASRLVAEYGDLESLLSAARRITGKVGSRILQGAESARTAFALFQYRTDVPLGINLKELRYLPHG